MNFGNYRNDQMGDLFDDDFMVDSGNGFNGGSMGNTSNKVVSLSKGQRVSLKKLDPSLTKVLVGLGWDTNRYDGSYDFDLDAAVFMCNASGMCHPNDFIFYNNLAHSSGSVVHQGDNRTGEGEGDDEQIFVDLTKVPDYITKIAVTVTIFAADKRKQTFGHVENAFIRIVNEETGNEVLRYDLTEEYSVETALVVAELYRHNGEWKFNAIGSGFQGGLAAICGNFGIDAEE